jgi:hypothetical protein
MDVSPDHEPTLIERGMDIHLNHPLTAQRGVRDSRLARWESWTPHPSALWKDDEGAYKQVGELNPIASSGPGSGARCTATPPGYAPNTRECRYVRTTPLRPAETLPMQLKLTPRTLTKCCGKTLQEHPRSCKASGAIPAGALARPHETAEQPGGKKVPSASVSLCGFLTDTTAESWGLLSGTTIRVP